MFRFSQNTKRSLDSLLNLITDLVGDGLPFFRLLFRSRTSLSVKVLFLRKQLASITSLPEVLARSGPAGETCGRRNNKFGSHRLTRARTQRFRTGLLWARATGIHAEQSRQKQRLQSRFHEVIDHRRIQDALGAPARLCHRNQKRYPPLSLRFKVGQVGQFHGTPNLVNGAKATT